MALAKLDVGNGWMEASYPIQGTYQCHHQYQISVHSTARQRLLSPGGSVYLSMALGDEFCFEAHCTAKETET